jgi:hypothetical protein
MKNMSTQNLIQLDFTQMKKMHLVLDRIGYNQISLI